MGQMRSSFRKETSGLSMGIYHKYNADGTIESYKVRFVAKGYTQTYDIDYSETFSLVAKIDTSLLLFSAVANKE